MLEVADLARRYGDVVALDGLSFTVEQGQLFGFVGPNGAGKTTTLRIILGVLEPDAGEARRPRRDARARRVVHPVQRADHDAAPDRARRGTRLRDRDRVRGDAGGSARADPAGRSHLQRRRPPHRLRDQVRDAWRATKTGAESRA